MFRFADDVAHKSSNDFAMVYPQLAKYIQEKMQVHSFQYTQSIHEIQSVQPEITDLNNACEIISTMLKPYGWYVAMIDYTVIIQMK